MKTTFLKSDKTQDSGLIELINAAFDEAVTLRQKKCVEQSIQMVDKYFESCRGAINIQTQPKPESKIIITGEHQAVKDANLSCDSITVNMDNISNLIETWMALISDALLRTTKPYSISRTDKPNDVSQPTEDELVDNVQDIIGDNLLPFSQGDESIMAQLLDDLIVDNNGGHDFVREVRDAIYDIVRTHKEEIADETAQAIDDEMSDQLQESNYARVIRELYRSFARDRYAILKAPQYVFGYRDRVSENRVEEVLDKFLFFEVIDIDNYYAAPNTTIHDNGSYEIELSKMTFSEMMDAKKCEGFIESGIDQVADFFKNCDRQWTDENWNMANDETEWLSFEEIPVMKGRIKAPGCHLRKFGVVDDKNIENDQTTYELIFWKIHDFIIYGSVTLNRKPVGLYRVGGWVRTGTHVYDSKGITEIAMPYQRNIDKSYQHMLKNQEFSSLGIWGYNRRKIDLDDFEPEDLVGGIALPVKTSPTDGSNDRPIFNIRSDSNVNELLTGIAHQQQQMEEQAQISALSVGITTRIGSSIRTTGLGSLIQNNANRQTLSKVAEIEDRFVEPSFRDHARIIIWTSKDPRILTGSIDIQVESLSDIIRQGDESENIDFFIQNIIGIINAIGLLEQQGNDTTGLRNLIGKYAESKGFSADDVFGRAQQVSAITDSIQSIEPSNVPLDGRSRPNISTELRI